MVFFSESEKIELFNETSPKVVDEFTTEKMNLFFDKLDSVELDETGIKKIDLGDNSSVTIITEDVSEDTYASTIEKNLIIAKASTPGATTLWKKYGSRKFTATFRIRTGILDVDLIMINHYTLSSKGVKLRYGESDVSKVRGNIDLGSASAGAVNEVKKTAYKKGESIHISSTFTYKWSSLYDATIFYKRFKMHNYVKFSDIDKKEREVKVVQSWNGKYLKD